MLHHTVSAFLLSKEQHGRIDFVSDKSASIGLIQGYCYELEGNVGAPSNMLVSREAIGFDVVSASAVMPAGCAKPVSTNTHSQ
jgi:hypothetical protein